MRFLIVKTSSLGDIIHAFHALAYLRNRFPKSDHQIDWVVEKPFAELVEAHPAIDKTLHIQSKNWRKGLNLRDLIEFRNQLQQETYDAVFDLQGNLKSAFITWLAKSSHKVGYSFQAAREWPNTLFTHHRFTPPPGQNIREDYLSIIKQYFQDNESKTDKELCIQLHLSKEQQIIVEDILAHPILQDRQKILVCPSSAWKNKQMSSDALITLLQQIQKVKPSTFLFIWGNSDEQREAFELQKHFHETSLVIDRLKLPTLQFLMSQMDLVISMDSLPLHLAGTTKTKTLGIFGPSSSKKYSPYGEHHIAFQGSCPYQREFQLRCKYLRTCPTGLCLKQLNGNEVFHSSLAN